MAFVVLIALALPALALFMLWLGMFVDILITKSDVWFVSGHDRMFSLLLTVGLGPLGAVLYGIFIRPQLARVEAQVEAERPRRANEWAA